MCKQVQLSLKRETHKLQLDDSLCQTAELVLDRVSIDATFSGSRFKFFIHLFAHADNILIRNEMRGGEMTSFSSSLDSKEYNRKR